MLIFRGLFTLCEHLGQYAPTKIFQETLIQMLNQTFSSKHTCYFSIFFREAIIFIYFYSHCPSRNYLYNRLILQINILSHQPIQNKLNNMILKNLNMRGFLKAAYIYSIEVSLLELILMQTFSENFPHPCHGVQYVFFFF